MITALAIAAIVFILWELWCIVRAGDTANRHWPWP